MMFILWYYKETKMFSNIINTTIVKVLNAIITFAVLTINARMLGATDLGTIGLILLAITVILLLNNLIGGSALIFLVPRFSLKRIALISYVWSVCTSAIGITVFTLLNIEPAEYTRDIFLLSLILGIIFVNQNILVGKGFIKFFNVVSFLQYITLLIIVITIFYFLKSPSIKNYLSAMYISWGLQLIITITKVLTLFSAHSTKKTDGLVRAMLKYGLLVQIANLTQYLTYRITYYFVEYYTGRASLGIFEVGNKIADGIWLFGKSISLVQYSWIANATKEKNTVITTLRLFKLSLLIGLSLVIVMISLQETIYLQIFGNDFEGIHKILVLLAPGIVSLSGAMILAHHFAGIGKHKINTLTSVIALLFIITLCFILVPGHGVSGAAIAASFTYLFLLVFKMIVFNRITNNRWIDYLPSKHDLLFARNILKSRMSLHSKRNNGQS